MQGKAVAQESPVVQAVKASPSVVVRPTSPGKTRVSIPNPRQGAEPRADSWTLELTEAERRFLQSALGGLTPREREVVYEICAGGTNETIADRICVALPTLRTHLMRLNQKLGTTSKGDVVRFVSCRLLWGYRNQQIQGTAPGD